MPLAPRPPGRRARPLLLALLTLALVLVTGSPRPAAATTTDGTRLIVMFAPGRAVAAADAAADRVDGEVAGSPVPDAVVVEVPAGRLGRAAARLRARADVEWVEEDVTWSADLVPNDPCLGQCVPSCAFPCLSGRQWALDDVRAPEAWAVTTGDPGVLVAVVDSGVDAAHPELVGKVVGSRNFTSQADVDVYGHGTHVAGTIAAATDNGYGVAGLGWRTRVLAVKVLDDNGEGLVSWIAAGIRYGADAGAKVVNLSLGSPARSQLVDDAVAYARARGAVVVASAGNEGSTQRNYPAATAGVVGVASSTHDRALSDFSNRGSDWVDIAAPGSSILSLAPAGGFASWSGTSMAAPHVSATAALIRAARPDLSGDQVVAALLGTAAPLSAPAGAVATGRLDAAAALLSTVVVPVPVPPPAVTAPPPAATPTASAPPASSSRTGSWLVSADGGVFAFGQAPFLGSTGGIALNLPIVGMAATPSGRGYWLVARDGGIFSFGETAFHGSTGDIRLNQPIVGMASTRTGQGYWLVASDGGIFAFGDAGFHGSTGDIRLNQPIVAMAPTASGSGYWFVASDGGIFAFGDAGFHGSAAGRSSSPVTGMAATRTGQGYWLATRSGAVITFGDAPALGSLDGVRLGAPVVGLQPLP